MNKHIEKIQRVLDKGVFYNLALILLSIIAFGGWHSLKQSPISEDHNDDTLAFLEQLRVGESDGIHQSVVSSTIRGKSVFRTARVVSVKTVDALGRYELVGTSIRGEKWKAYIRDTKMNKTHSVKLGDGFGGVFEVLEIERNALTVKRGNETMKLEK